MSHPSASRGSRAFRSAIALAIALIALVTAVQTANSYEYHTGSPSPDGLLTLPSGLTFEAVPSGQTTVLPTQTHETSNAAGAMFLPTNFTIAGRNVIAFQEDVSGCPSNNGTYDCDRGTLTINFGRRVVNPVLHLSGLGGSSGNYRFSAEGELTGSVPAGATVSGIAPGATNLELSGQNWRVANANDNSTCDDSSGGRAAAGCGTIQINGTVSQLTFQMRARIYRNCLLFCGTISGQEHVRLSFTDRQDFSDAPASYDSPQAPAHAMTDLRLGSTVDEDNATVENPTTSPSAVAAGANANGTNGDGADEDAISSWPALTTGSAGQTYSVTVPVSGTSAASRLCGWIDFNRNGTFDPGERACASVAASATSAGLSWSVPAASSLTAGITYARLRISNTTAQAESPTGLADSGEVEDYTVAIMPQVRVNKTLSAPANYSTDSFNLLINGTTFATAVSNGGTTSARTLFHDSTYGAPSITVASNIASAAVPYSVSETATGTNQGIYTSSYACLDGSGGSVAAGSATSYSGNLPQSSGSNAAAQNVTCTFTNTFNPSVPAYTAPSNGSILGDNTPTLTGTSNPGVTIKIYDSVNPLVPVCTTVADASGNWSCTPAAPVPDGTRTFNANASWSSNTSGNTTVTVTVDTAAPDTSISSSPAAVTNSTAADFSFGSDESPVTYECNLDGAGWSACSASASFGPVGQGDHTLLVRASDAAANTDATPASFSWSVDTTDPSIAITGPSAPTGDNTPQITGTTDQPDGSSVTVKDGGGATLCSATVAAGAWSCSPSSPLPDGVNQITAQTTDSAGNTASASFTVTIKVNIPKFEIAITGPSGTLTSNTPTITGTSTAPEGSAVVVTIPDPSNPGNTITLCTATVQAGGTWSCQSTTALPDGQVVLTATVEAGGSPSTASTTVRSDFSASDPTACLKTGITIIDLSPKGKTATMLGFARRTYAGQKVTVTGKLEGARKILGTATVQPDGSFSVKFKAPKKKYWNTNKALYRATVGSESTKLTKLVRRVRSATVSYVAGKLTVKGDLIKPLMPKAKATIQARSGCSGKLAQIGTTKIKTNGTFKTTLSYQGSGVVWVRVGAVVSKGGKKPKPLKTYSYLIPVILGE